MCPLWPRGARGRGMGALASGLQQPRLHSCTGDALFIQTGAYAALCGGSVWPLGVIQEARQGKISSIKKKKKERKKVKQPKVYTGLRKLLRWFTLYNNLFFSLIFYIHLECFQHRKMQHYIVSYVSF